MKRVTLMMVALVLMFGGLGRAKADFIANVTLDTTALTKNSSQGPFEVGFLLTNAQGFTGANTATISNFTLHGSSLGNVDSNTGPPGVTGGLSSTLTLTDNISFSGPALFTQFFTPGSQPSSSLSFTLDLTTNLPGIGNDLFTFSATSTQPGSIPSSLSIETNIPNPKVPTVTTQGGSLVNGTSLPAPVVTEVSSVPEPSTITLLSLGSIGLLGYGWRRRKQVA